MNKAFEQYLEDREVMEDMVLTCVDILTPREIACAINEGITKLESVEQALAKL